MSEAVATQLTYLDNAATSWPKPPEVARAMKWFLDRVGANPGRSGHRLSILAARVVYEARETLAELLGIADPLRIIFCANATHALNLALRGLLRPGCHVIATGLEHNSVIRPLHALEAEGVTLTIVDCEPDGTLHPATVAKALRPETALIVMTHASNVVGTILPVREVAAVAREHGALLLVDAAQSLGAFPFTFAELEADLLAFTGHKALYGPMGTGGLVIGERVDTDHLDPLMRGGTGSESDSELQPDFLPDKFESGTLNVVGLAGLEAAVRWLRTRGVQALRERETHLTARLIEGLLAIGGVRVQGPLDAHRRVPVVSFTIEGRDPGEIGWRLDQDFGIAARVGLHCSPLAHKTLGTYPQGTVRLSLGAFTTEREVDRALQAIRRFSPEYRGRRRSRSA